MHQFQYLLDRIDQGEISDDPFPHLYLEDFLSDVDFKEVTGSADIRLPVVSSLDELFEALEKAGYEIIDFPGCTRSRHEYARWLEKSMVPARTHGACESQGMVLRLSKATDDTVQSLDAFLRSSEMQAALRTKFGITEKTTVQAGVQKYLRGYEISPHPDIRQKALTWMLNINPADDSEALDIHTHYLKLKPEWQFISELWKYNPTVETCWVPWDWCSTVKRQTKNNSIVIFSPQWNTVHAVRASYDHFATQRTQFYGNLWYEKVDLPHTPEFKDFDFTGSTDRDMGWRDYADSSRRQVERVGKRVRDRVGSARRQLGSRQPY